MSNQFSDAFNYLANRDKKRKWYQKVPWMLYIFLFGIFGAGVTIGIIIGVRYF